VKNVGYECLCNNFHKISQTHKIKIALKKQFQKDMAPGRFAPWDFIVLSMATWKQIYTWLREVETLRRSGHDFTNKTLILS